MKDSLYIFQHVFILMNQTTLQEKNVSTDVLDGKIGRMYMPKQDVDTMALKKMKGLKRERREKAEAAAANGKKARTQESDDDSE